MIDHGRRRHASETLPDASTVDLRARPSWIITYSIAAGISHYRADPERLAELRQSLDARGLGDQWERAQRMADDPACWLDFAAMTSAH